MKIDWVRQIGTWIGMVSVVAGNAGCLHGSSSLGGSSGTGEDMMWMIDKPVLDLCTTDAIHRRSVKARTEDVSTQSHVRYAVTSQEKNRFGILVSGPGAGLWLFMYQCSDGQFVSELEAASLVMPSR